MKTTRVLVLALLWPGVMLLAATEPVDGMQCSIHPKAGTAPTDLAALANVSKEKAQATALASLKSPATAIVVEGELEVERGCLVFSFDIRLPGRPGVEEVMVDAGNGKVLSHRHESAKHEAAEKMKDAAKKKAEGGNGAP